MPFLRLLPLGEKSIDRPDLRGGVKRYERELNLGGQVSGRPKPGIRGQLKKKTDNFATGVAAFQSKNHGKPAKGR